MRKLLISLLIAMFTLSFFASDVHAKRFGGGGSFGMSRQANSFSRMGNPSRYQTPIATPKPASSPSRWLGPLAGFATGALLTSLFMGHGVGSGIFSWLLIAGAIFFVWRLFSNRMQPVTQPPIEQSMNYQPQQQPFSNAASSSKPFFSSAPNASSDLPAGFDEAAFLRQAKATFIRLQAAYDAKNLADIREFTSPQIFGEIQIQIQERGDAPNQTDVINIDAQLADVSVEADHTIASVIFSGLIREELGAEPVSIKEIWHFEKNSYMPNWVVAGIQQA